MTSLLEAHHPAASGVAPSASNDDIPLPPPIPSFQLRRAVEGIETELLIQSFDDRILVVLTQNGKVGCLVRFISLFRVSCLFRIITPRLYTF